LLAKYLLKGFQIDIIAVLSLTLAASIKADWVRVFFYLRFYYFLNFNLKVEKIF